MRARWTRSTPSRLASCEPVLERRLAPVCHANHAFQPSCFRPQQRLGRCHILSCSRTQRVLRIQTLRNTAGIGINRISENAGVCTKPHFDELHPHGYRSPLSRRHRPRRLSVSSRATTLKPLSRSQPRWAHHAQRGRRIVAAGSLVVIRNRTALNAVSVASSPLAA